MESKVLSAQTTVNSYSELEQSTKTFFSTNVLPIFDKLSQLYLPIRFPDVIQTFICILQIIETSFWDISGNFFKNQKINDILHYCTFFSSSDPSSYEIYIIFGVFTSIVLVVSIAFIILTVHYKQTRRFFMPLLYFVRFYSLSIGTLIIYPFVSLISHFVIKIIDEHNIQYYFLFVISVICYFIALSLYYLNQHFVNQSIYIHKLFHSTFDSSNIDFLFILNPLFLFFAHIFKYYPIWSFYILVIIHIMMICIISFNYIWCSFIFNIADFASAALFTSLIFNDIFRLIIENFSQFGQQYFVLICLVVFVVLCMISFFVFKFIRVKINFNLSYSKLTADENSSDEANLKAVELSNEEKYAYFADIGLDHKMSKAMIYLIIGFTSGSDMFVDFSLVQFCIDNYKDNEKMLVLLIRLLSYFKAEKNRFNMVLKQFHFQRNTSLYGRFIYNQAYKVKLFRQSTSTNFSTTRLNELKIQSANLENQVKMFWTLETANTQTLEKLEEQQRKLSDLWDESIEDNWSSVSFREEHIHFLIESCTNFQKAVLMTSIKDKIDVLMKERDDLCFLSLVACFPQYIKKKIIDTEGNFLMKKSSKDHSYSSSVSNQNTHTSTSSYDNDFSLEEQIANQILSYGRLRLSMQNALAFLKPTTGKLLTSYSIISIIASLVMIIGTFAYYVNSFDSFNDWNNQVGVLNELRVAYGRAFLSLSIMHGQKLNIFDIIHFGCELENDTNHFFFDNSIPFDELAMMYVNEARTQYSELMAAILELSLRRYDTSTLTSLFFESSIKSNLCYFDKIIDRVNWSMEQTLNFGILSFAILAEDDEIENWYQNNSYWCHDLTTIPEVQRMFSVIQDALMDDLSKSSKASANRIKLQMALIGPLFFIIFLVPFPIILLFYAKDIDHLIAMMLSTDDEYKEQARKNISLSNVNENNSEVIQNHSKNKINWKVVFYSIFALFIFCLFILTEELILYFTYLLNINVGYYGSWSCNFALLRSNLNDILIDVINAVFLVSYNKSYITNLDLKNRINSLLMSIKNVVFEIVIDSINTPSAVGKDEVIDNIILQALCDNPLPMNLHDVYECASLNQLIAVIYTLVQKVTEEIETYNGNFKGEILSNLYHLIFSHAISSIRDVRTRYDIVKNNEISNYNKNITIILVCSLFLLVIWSFIMATILINYKRIYNMAICLIRRLSPVGLINNSELTNYLLYKKGEEIETGVTHTIFNSSFDGIICMNSDGIIEIINKSFANDYGYSTEQLVGQLIGTIFDNESRTKLENQLKLMKNHESTNYAEHVTCFTNDGRAVPSYITLFSIKGKENSLILVIRDETILLIKKKRLELAKKQSQDLLEQIMPSKVLSMLKEGKSEISFVVQSATVMFVNIVNFSGFFSDLSPQQIMGTLSTLFGSFDTWIQKYPFMTKIKLIGDSYMAACGLFMAEDDPSEHARQCLDFAIRVLNILDDTNIKLNVSLQIRIGVNTDGPIIAGVLGTENRVFDIIGDTINVASRLEHKAEPGHILMSEKTYDLVNMLGYDIVPIGKVFLKGKGDMQAYSI